LIEQKAIVVTEQTFRHILWTALLLAAPTLIFPERLR
jgi:hypothetical protein